MANDNDRSGSSIAFIAGVGIVLILAIVGVVLWVQGINTGNIDFNRGRREKLPPAVAEEGEAGEEAVAAAVPVAPGVDIDIDMVTAAVNKGGCSACHVIPNVPGAVGQVGPNLTNIGIDAATRREGYTAEEYIRESLMEPNAFTAPECPFGVCPPGAMPVLQLEQSEFDILTSYLSTLGVFDIAGAEPAGETTEAVAAAPPPSVALEPIIEPSAPAPIVASFNKGGCAGCHTIPGVPGANGQVGPDLTEIGTVAVERVSGQSGDEYLRESILNPNAFIAPDCPTGSCPENVMLQTFAQSLSDEDLESIVGYLALLGTDEAVALSLPDDAAALDASRPAEAVLDPFIPLPKDPPGEAQIALGKYLFFDPRLSNNNSLSCASCHQPENAFTDGEALSQGYPSTQYFRNVPSLYNTVYSDYLYRDGRMDGNDMATLVRDHITEAHFMSNDGRLMAERLNQVPVYVQLFNEAYGSGPGFGGTLNAITAYVQSLNSLPTPYDQYLAGDSDALSDEAQAGLVLFEGKAGCSGCHSGELLSDADFHNTGVATAAEMFEDPERHITFRRFFRVLGTPNYRNLREDVGLYAVTKEDEDWGKFYTPALREIDRTAPYMHNGSLTTLEDVVRFYNDGGGADQTADLEPLDLTDEEIDQLVAFMESLSSEPISVEAPILPDYRLLTVGGNQ